LKIKITSDSLGSSTFDGVERRFREVIGLVQGGDFSGQFVEFQLPESHQPIGVDKLIEFRVKSVTSLFRGRARLEGSMVTQ
jgi:hypothetical protein